jgi:hypothetical protein
MIFFYLHIFMEHKKTKKNPMEFYLFYFSRNKRKTKNSNLQGVISFHEIYF